MNTVLIIGGGQAGGAAALALRRHGFAGTIRIIGQEPLPPYERPALSKGYLLGTSPFDKLVLLPETLAAEQRITLTMGVAVTAIDRASRQVLTDDGQRLDYDALILATGGTARALPGVPVDDRRLFAIRTARDAGLIRERLADAGSMLVIGGGWLGLEVAASARKAGLAVTLIEAGPRLCGRALPPAVSDILAALHASQGVDLRIGEAPTDIGADADGMHARLADGTLIQADLGVIAIGLTVSDGLAATAGLAVRDGVLTDAAGRTGDPAVFAIGDCARFHHGFLGAELRLESWQNANLQAEAAARALLGLPDAAPEIPWFWSDQYHLTLQILGAPDPVASPIRRGDPDGGRGSLLWCDPAGRLRGIAALNAPRDIAMARRLIGAGLIVDPTRAADATVPLKDAVLATM
ncbi:FAD-dependent oxidoreductase (plasmid) [Tistrella bauzanensis]|uniref:NAD(P)/FAD-dependent oxidoreductase n=1 Tax=Tistrella TaxID=171436 RepID=UPI0031F6E6D0